MYQIPKTMATSTVFCKNKADLSTPDHQTTKIPDFILLNRSIAENKVLRKGIEARQIEIEQLKDEIQKFKNAIKVSNRETKEIKKDAMYKQMNEERSKNSATIHKLRMDNEYLISENIQLKKKLGVINL